MSVCDGASAAERSRERKHYLAIRYLSDSRYDAIDYLYNRLNIIDAKTSTLMNVNGLLLATITFLLGAAVSTDGNKLHLAGTSGLDKALIFATCVVVIFLAISTTYCFRIFSLTFDHIAKGALPKSNVTPTEHELSLLFSNDLAGYGAGSSLAIAEGDAEDTLADYEESFFCVTIKRQRYLRNASCFAIAAGLVVMLALLVFVALLWPWAGLS